MNIYLGMPDRRQKKMRKLVPGWVLLYGRIAWDVIRQYVTSCAGAARPGLEVPDSFRRCGGFSLLFVPRSLPPPPAPVRRHWQLKVGGKKEGVWK